MRIFLITVLLSFSVGSGAEIFRCSDSKGRDFFTDDKSKCPNLKDSGIVAVRSGDDARKPFYDEIPDLLQTKQSAGFPGGGKQFCAPVAVSNSLVWLEGKKDEQYQIDLVKKLSSSQYMNTHVRNGTGTTDLIRGVEKYAAEAWGGHRRLEYSGWRKCPAKYRTNSSVPTIQWMLSGLHRKGAVWLNVGWYKEDIAAGEYRRVGGHWVTLVGYDNGQLILHDPAPRAGSTFQNEYVTFSLLFGGELVGDKAGLPVKASGYFKLGQGMHIPSRADMAIIDGVVILEI